MNFLANWKTSGAGALMILMGIAALFGIKVGSNPITPDQAIATIIAGFGLLFAKDNNVTGGTSTQ